LAAEYRDKGDMVGRESKLRLSHLTSKILNKQYKLGEVDCFKVVYDYLKQLDYDIPTRFENVTIDDYAALYRSDVIEAKKLMLRFLQSYLDEVEVKFAFAGDILLMQFKTQTPFLAIDAGNGKILSASPQLGTNVISKQYYKTLRVFKCHK